MTADTQLALWIAHPVLQLGIGATMYKRKLHRSFPAFFSYIAFQVASFVLLFPIKQLGFFTLYFYLYWTFAAVNLILGFMIIYEVFLDVFRPYYTLKDLGNVMFKWAALVMLLVAFVVAASNSGQGMDPILQAIMTVERCVRVAQCGLVLFLIVFSRYLGVSWRQQSFGIALGLGGAAAVELATYALYVGSPMSQVTLAAINLVAYNLALMIWFSYALLKVPARTPRENLFLTHRWEQGLADLQKSSPGDSLIPMFESMVDRAFSRNQNDIATLEPEPAPAMAPVSASSSGSGLPALRTGLRRVR